MKLLFATQNQNKRDEVQAILGDGIEVASLKDEHFNEELPETHFTLEENALEKAELVYEKFQCNCFSEDTGLEIDALNGEPGVYSARYAGEGKNAKDNVQLVIEKMRPVSNRQARFRTVVCLLLDDHPHFFEGIVHGTILTEARGTSGFGYDPVFVPEGFEKTFAEMTNEEKNAISHRSKAILAMKKFIITVKK